MSRRAAGVAMLTGVAMLAGIAALAIYLRATQTYGTSWAGDRLVPYDTDPYYQLRRLELLRAGDFPPGVGDRFVNAPSRFDCPWPIGLPLLLDGIVRLATIGQAPPRHQVEAIAAFAIPVLGALTPLLLVLVLWPHGRVTAWVAGVAAAAVPSSRMAGHYGRIDHHVLEPAAALAMFALIFSAPGERRLRAALLGALVGAAAAFTLDLTFVFCAVLGGIGVLFALLDAAAGSRRLLGWRAVASWLRRSPGGKSGGAAGSQGAALAPAREPLATASIGHSRVERPLAVNAAVIVGMAAGISAATLGNLAIGAPRALGVDLRLAIAVTFAAGLLLARWPSRWTWSVLIAAALWAVWRGAAVGSWLTAPTDPVTHTMDEALPPWTHVTWAQALFHLFPIAVGSAVLGLGIGDKRRRDLPLLSFLVGLLLLNVAQSKYQALRALLECCGWGLLPALLALAVPPGWSLLRRALGPAVALGVVTASLLLLPPNPPLTQIAIARGLAEIAARVPRLSDPAYATPRAAPATITLAHPVDGVRFAYLAHVAVSALPFWGQPTSLAQYQETLELLRGPYGPELERRLDAWRVKYILVTKPRPQLGLYEQLRIALGSEHPGWPPTATVRLVADAGTAKLFERVRGASVRGHAGAGEKVSVDAFVRTALATIRYSASVTAGRDGTFRLIFPYANGGDWPTKVAGIQLRCAERTRTIEVSDRAVESGDEVVADCNR